MSLPEASNDGVELYLHPALKQAGDSPVEIGKFDSWLSAKPIERCAFAIRRSLKSSSSLVARAPFRRWRASTKSARASLADSKLRCKTSKCLLVTRPD